MKTNPYFIILLLISVFSNLNAQNPTFEWANQMGGVLDSKGWSIITDNNGNVYSTGSFLGTVDFDPGAGTMNLTSNGSQDIFIQKLDTDGKLLWVKQIAGVGIGLGVSIKVDPSGNVYTTGYFEGVTDFDPGTGVRNLTSNGGRDIFIQKLDDKGNLLWVKQMGGTNRDVGVSMAIDNVSIYITGYFQGVVDFDPGTGVKNLTSNGDNDIFIQKLDSNGNLLWVKQIGGPGDDRAQASTLDLQGNIYITGGFSGTVDFDPSSGSSSLNSTGSQDAFIQKFDTAGNFLWVKHISGNLFKVGSSIATDALGNIYSVGYFLGAVSFEQGSNSTTLVSNGGYDMFICKHKTDGSLIWLKQIGGLSSDFVLSMSIDASAGLYFTGSFRQTVDFDPGVGDNVLTANGGSDIFILRLDSAGNYSWAKSIGGLNLDEARSITNDNRGGILTTGSFQNAVDFNPGTGVANLSSIGNNDIFIQKLRFCPISVSSITEDVCNGYRSPSGKLIMSSGTFEDTIQNRFGCDSIITINLTITPVDTSVSQFGERLISNATNAFYQWVDCNNNYSFIPGEDQQSFTPQTDGAYAVIVLQNACEDTSKCYVSTVSLDELSFIKKVSVSPNPTNGISTIKLPKSYGEVTVKVRNVQGQKLSEDLYRNKQVIDINISNLSGIYFIELTTNLGERGVLKIIRN